MIRRLFPFIISILTLCCKTSNDCARFKNGRFYTISPTTKNKIIIERNDSIQIETNIQTGIVAKCKIAWNNPCEYKIIGMSSNKKIKDGIDSFLSIKPINVTIVNTAKDYYVFQIIMDSASKHVEYSDTIHIEN